MPANADSSRTPKNRNAASDPRTKPSDTLAQAGSTSTVRRSKVVATGGCGTLLGSSLAQAFNLVPAQMQTELHAVLAAAAALGVCYVMLPHKAKITLEWER
jgi:hypothetical protein